MKKNILFIPILLFLASCSSSRVLTIASKYGTICDGESGCICRSYFVKESNNSSWQLMDLLELKGFPYELGYEYKIIVNSDGVYDHTVSKTKKDSEGPFPTRIFDESWGWNTRCEDVYEKEK